MKILNSLLFGLLFFLAACQEEVPAGSPVPPRTDVPITELFFFKAEKQLEMYQKQHLVDSLSISINTDQLPIGLFHLEKEKTYFYNQKDTIYMAQISNEAIHKKMAALKGDPTAIPLLIFPNDARKSGTFMPCFACPHTTAAVYAQLEMYLLEKTAAPINNHK